MEKRRLTLLRVGEVLDISHFPAEVRFIIQYLIDAFHEVGIQLLGRSDPVLVLFQLRCLAAAQQTHCHILVLDGPAKSQRHHRHSHLFGDLHQLLHLLVLLLCHRVFAPEAAQMRVATDSRILWNALQIFASEHSGMQWTPNGGRVSIRFRIHWHQIFLNTVSGQHVVIGLLHDRRHQLIDLCHPIRFSDFLGCPVRCTPIKGLSRLNNVIEATHDLFHWSEVVDPMCIDHIDIVQLQSLQRLVHAFHQMLAR
mmetsp:Transcript_2091/g.3375  ORF Transcript_2091/g.3375 Transcript_2091/m.3375 type:complete len:253 (-) Transcript_2091:490-1248(-)